MLNGFKWECKWRFWCLKPLKHRNRFRLWEVRNRFKQNGAWSSIKHTFAPHNIEGDKGFFSSSSRRKKRQRVYKGVTQKNSFKRQTQIRWWWVQGEVTEDHEWEKFKIKCQELTVHTIVVMWKMWKIVGRRFKRSVQMLEFTVLRIKTKIWATAFNSSKNKQHLLRSFSVFFWINDSQPETSGTSCCRT